jgi:ribosomal protein S15P/S13E
MVNKRRALMRHLKKHDFEAYKRVVVEMDLIKEATELSKYRS